MLNVNRARIRAKTRNGLAKDTTSVRRHVAVALSEGDVQVETRADMGNAFRQRRGDDYEVVELQHVQPSNATKAGRIDPCFVAFM